jgi:DNA-binding transcriptional LysR family regulator
VAQLANFRLKVFRAVAEQLSFRRAAEALYLTQPAVTQQVKALEDDLQIRLFQRAGNQVELTSAGGRLLAYVRRIDVLLTEAEQELAAIRGSDGGELRIGISTTISQYVLPRILGEFHREHPGVRLGVQTGNTQEIVDALMAQKISLGLIEGPPRRREVQAEAFLEDELVFIVPATHEWAQQESISIEQMMAAPLLVREQGSGTRRVLELALTRCGVKIKSLNLAMELDSTEAIKSAVEAGLGVGFASRWAIYKEEKMGTIKVVKVNTLRVLRDFTLVYRSGPKPSGPAGVFRRFALERKGLLSPDRGRMPADKPL